MRRVKGSVADSKKDQIQSANQREQHQRNEAKNPEPGTRNPEPGFSNPEPGTLLWADLGEASAIEPVIKAFRQEIQQ